MADVTVCIPAFAAEAFIDRTLDSVRAQTHVALRILVSVDACADATVARCRAHAAVDPRIEVIEQPVRLGWAANINDLLARVRSGFACLVFHDDLVDPTYIDRLLAALLADPEAASAHSDLVGFGDRDDVEPGREYTGSAPKRVLEFLREGGQGAPLRSLVRRSLLDQGLRLPVDGPDGQWRCLPYSLRLLAAGNARRIAEPLYRRCFRAGSVSATTPARDHADGEDLRRACEQSSREAIDAVPGSAAQRELLATALALRVMDAIAPA
jgi:glycosyltransferase involved in cell wall biosynthesis